MSFPYYSGKGLRERDAGATDLPAPPIETMRDPKWYLADEGLRNAANVALLVGRPLLLTGEPGTGKTDFAWSLAWELKLGDPLTFETKSSSSARDLFYVYDTIGRFHAAHSASPGSVHSVRDDLDYITYVALGLAMVLGNPAEAVKHVLPPDFEHPGTARRSVVLIDEIDKAPRDFPNDILSEVDRMFFKIPEIGNKQVPANPKMRPIIVITSNSERHLPDPFLRRCVYYDVPFPSPERLRDIVELRFRDFVGGDTPLLNDCLEFFYILRTPTSGLRKKPSTAELLDWLLALRGVGARADTVLHHEPRLAATTLSALVKGEDQDRGRSALEAWVRAKASTAPADIRAHLDSWSADEAAPR